MTARPPWRISCGKGPIPDPRRAPAPDVIVLDLPLPRLSGPEVVQRLRQDPRFHSVPIIVLAPWFDQ